MKRIKLDDLSGGSLFDSDYVFEVLKNVDVRDAMRAALASGNDPRWRYVIEHMRKDSIWRYWMKRDMGIVFEHANGELPIWLQPGRQPSWKVYYLWMRFIIGFVQWNILCGQKMEQILMAYPPNSSIRYVTLNTMELTVVGDQFVRSDKILLDFRTEFPKILALFRNPASLRPWQTMRYPLDNLLQTSFFKPKLSLGAPSNSDRNDIAAFLKQRYKIDATPGMFVVYTEAVDYLLWWLERDTLQRFSSRNMAGEPVQSLLNSPPRAMEYTHLLLAGQIQCNMCNSHIPEMKCKHCDTYFCDTKCGTGHTH